MKWPLFLLCLWPALAIPKDQFQTAAAAIRERLSPTETGSFSTHSLQAEPEKHDPFIVFSGDTATVKVRGPGATMTNLHPQTPEHFILYIWVEDQNGKVVHMAQLSGNDAAPTTDFSWTDYSGTLTPYSLCNLHGLWQGPTYNLEYERAVVQIMSRMDKSAAGPGSYHAYADSLVKHSPFVSSAKHGIAHLGVAGSDTDPTTVFHVQTPEHYITLIYVKDQHGAVAGVRRLEPKDGAKLHSLTIHKQATSLTPYEYCNLHGLWEGPRFTPKTEQEL